MSIDEYLGDIPVEKDIEKEIGANISKIMEDEENSKKD